MGETKKPMITFSTTVPPPSSNSVMRDQQKWQAANCGNAAAKK